MRTFILNGMRGCCHICHQHLLQLRNHTRESGAVIVPCIADDLTDVIYLTSCHLVAHDHVSNHHTSTADRVLAGNHLLVGATYHEDVEPQFIVKRPVDLVELSNDGVPANLLTLGHKSDMRKRHLSHRL